MIRIFAIGLLKIRSTLAYLRFLFKLKFGKFRPVDPCNAGPTIIFVGDILQARIPRLIQAINRNEKQFKIKLWVCGSKVSSEFSHGLKIPVRLFSNVWDLLYELKAFDNQGTIVHFFEPKASTAKSIHSYLYKAKYLFDFQDVYSTYYGINPPIRWMKKQVDSEAYVLSHFLNIISNSLEINYASRLHSAKPKNRLLFLPYCESRFFQNPTRTYSPEFALVYAGGISGSAHESQQDSAITNLLPLATLMEKRKIAFHIFPSPNVGNEILNEYRKFSATTKYFKLEKSINQEDLSKELASFQFGILPFFEKGGWKGSAKMKYAISLKLFNFIEAGIPIIVSADIEFQAWIIRRYQLGIVVHSEEEIASTVENMSVENYIELLKKVKENRELLSLDHQIIRLFQFYSNLK